MKKFPVLGICFFISCLIIGLNSCSSKKVIKIDPKELASMIQTDKDFSNIKNQIGFT